ncbi:MAG TPA: Ig-like domain-containing protein [bacterium]|nr:Ig-like domain-containing protein [bacterium]
MTTGFITRRIGSTRGQRGLTLIELIIAMAIFAIIMVPMVLLVTGAGTGFNESSKRAELQRRGRMALQAMVAAVGQAGADPTGMDLFEAIPEAAPNAVVVAADYRGDEPDTPPDGDADDRAERVGFRLVPGGSLVNEIGDPERPDLFDLSRDVRDFRVVYRDAADEIIAHEALVSEKAAGVLARRRIRSLELTLTLAPADDPRFAPIVLTTTVTPVNLASRYLGAAAGGVFPTGEEAGKVGEAAVPGEGAPPQGPPVLLTQGAAAELRDSGVGSPRVIFDSPVDGALVRGPVPVGAAAYDADGAVRQVEFYLDDRVLGVDGYAPYDALDGGWNPVSGDAAVPDGHHLLYALAVDNRHQVGSDSLMVEVRSGSGPALYLDTSRPAYVLASRELTGAFGVKNSGDAEVRLTQLRVVWNRRGLLLSGVEYEGVSYFSDAEGVESGDLVPLKETLVLPPGASGELIFQFIPGPGANSPRLEGARLAVLAADAVGRRWGMSCYLTPASFVLDRLLIQGSAYLNRWADYYRLTRLVTGDALYSDERYSILTFPISYDGLVWLLTADRDRTKGSGEAALGRDFLGRLRADNRVHVYLLYDDTATPPMWVRDDFMKSRYVALTDNPRADRLRVWLGTAEPGEVFFYGNRSAGVSDNADCMYMLGFGGLFAPGTGE